MKSIREVAGDGENWEWHVKDIHIVLVTSTCAHTALSRGLHS